MTYWWPVLFVGAVLWTVLAYELYSHYHPKTSATISRLIWAFEDRYRGGSILVTLGLVALAVAGFCHFVLRWWSPPAVT